ncbi:hypothetical protein QBC45DRAFT_461669 [Copromyces sp. CBS 386.78]|nr:hypothetical protein QBC45DRAFT_461669 [Copromyces sp. CBS 386.78]
MDRATPAEGTLPSLPSSLSLVHLPTEILLLIIEHLKIDAKGPKNECAVYLVIRTREHRRRMIQAVAALGSLAQTCRRFHRLVQPLLYEEPFVLDEEGFVGGERLYKLIRTLVEDKSGLADLVKVYREPRVSPRWSLGEYMGEIGWPRFDGPSELEKALRSLFTRHFPWLARNYYQRSAPTYKRLKDLDIFLDMVPTAILCHCRNIRRLDHLNIGIRGRRSPDVPYIRNHLVDNCVEFINLESANLVASYWCSSIIDRDEEEEMEPTAGFETYNTPIVEAFRFIRRAPNLKHLSLTGFSSENWAGETRIWPLPSLQNLSSLELHYYAWLCEEQLHGIIGACPNLASFKFTSEAGPTTGRPIVSDSGFEFVGPTLLLKALRSRSETLKAISIRYMPVLDFLFRLEGSMDTDKNLIRSLGHFPNLRVLQVSHGALGWKESDGPEEQQLVRLVKGCPRLESLDITQIDIREARIRPQLEGLTAAVACLNCTPLLKGIRVSLENNNWHRSWTRRALGANASELFERDHLIVYQQTDIKLLIDFEHAYENFGTFSPVNDGLRHAVTLHPDIVRVSGLDFERGNGKKRFKDCGHHEIPGDDVPESITLQSFHWQHGTKVLYGVLADGRSTERYVNERRKLAVMHRDYGPWGFGVRVQGVKFDGLTVVD